MRTPPGALLGALLCAAACAHAPARGAERRVVAAPQESGTTALLIAVSPATARIAWASGARGTFLRTVDGGAHWTAGIVPGADSLQFRDVQAFDSVTAVLLSIGDGDRSRIYRTADGGAHWALALANPDPKGFFDCLAFWDRARGLAVGDAVGDAMTVFLTSDGGASWTRVPPASLPRAAPGEGSFAASGTCVAARPGGRAWIVMNDSLHARLLRTADFGAHWTIDTLPLTTRAGVGAQSVSFRDDRHGIVLAGGYAAKPGDAESAITSDGGATWTPRARPPLASGVWGGTYVPGADPPVVVAVGPAGAVHSLDDAASWAVIDTLDYWSVAFASPTAGWAVGKDGRISALSVISSPSR